MPDTARQPLTDDAFARLKADTIAACERAAEREVAGDHVPPHERDAIIDDISYLLAEARRRVTERRRATGAEHYALSQAATTPWPPAEDVSGPSRKGRDL